MRLASGIVKITVGTGGTGYSSAPTVSISGGGGTGASAVAQLAGTVVDAILVTNAGTGYTSTPTVSISGGSGSGAAATASVLAYGGTNVISMFKGRFGDLYGVDGNGRGFRWLGDKDYLEPIGISKPTAAPTVSTVSGTTGNGVRSISIVNGGAGYFLPPTVAFTGGGLTDGSTLHARGRAKITNAVVVGVTLDSRGEGYVSAPQVVFTGGLGSGAAFTVNCTSDGATTNAVYRVTSVSVATGGTGYMSPPAIGFRPVDGYAVAVAAVSNGSISSVSVLAGGNYSAPPTAVVEDTSAKAIASISNNVLGTYQCCIRYIDSTPAKNNGPRASSISELTEVTVSSGAAGLEWQWTNNAVESRVDKIELWRTTADQQLVLYRVAVLSKTDGVLPRTYTDTLSDDDLLDPSRTDFGIMPIVMPSGQINARRFEVPQDKYSQACMFQDRAWYSVDSTGESPNSLWHSEVDEPESAPSAYEIVLQENANESDSIVGIVPFGSSLLIFQSRHLYRLQYVSQPLIDASMILAAYRGALHARCVDVYDGVAFAADSYGMYAFDGQSAETISIPVDNYWRDGIIDFSKSKHFHVSVNPNDRVVRFYYCKATDGTYPTRALCFCLATKTWWEETYAQAVPSSAMMAISGRLSQVVGGDGSILKHSPGAVDSGATAIPYEFRSGNHALADEPSREIGVLYKPTATTADLQLRLHYNGSSSPRANAIMSDRGDGITVATGSTAAVLDMRSDRSSLGSAPGYATARYAGRMDPRSAGGDKHAAVAIGGEKGTGEVVVYGVTMGGVT